MLSFQLKQAAIISLILSTISPAAAQIRGHRGIKTSKKKLTKSSMQKLMKMTPAGPTSSSSLVYSSSYPSSSYQLTSSTRIVGGSQAQRGDYPYYTQWVGGCGASLIHEDIVLSAAHCMAITENQVIVGGYQNEVVEGGSVARTIVKRVAHPNYDDSSFSYDFVVLKLDAPVANKPVMLNRDAANPTTGEDLIVVGLGTLAEDGNAPIFLQDVTVQAVAHATCNSQYAGGIDKVSMFCAGVVGGGKDSCQGDSGGPIVEIVNGEHTQLGVVSWGEGCAQAGVSGVYARVSTAATWIDQQICILSANPPTSCRGGVVATPAPAAITLRPPSMEAPTMMLMTSPSFSPITTEFGAPSSPTSVFAPSIPSSVLSPSDKTTGGDNPPEPVLSPLTNEFNGPPASNSVESPSFDAFNSPTVEEESPSGESTSWWWWWWWGE